MTKKKTKIISPVKSQKALERRYTIELNKLGKALIKAVNSELLPFLKTNQEQYAMDGLNASLNMIFARLNSRFTGTATIGFAQQLAEYTVGKVDSNNRKKFDKTVEKATGVNLSEILQQEGLEDFIQLSINKNVKLIKTLPEQYLSQVETIINNGVISGARYQTIANEIYGKVGSANEKLINRIKVIARNEISTINAQLTMRRSESLGIKEGIYRTSEDERVRPCHMELNGIRFELKKGAWSKKCQKFIQPGITDINCRCSYSPIIEV